MSNRFQSNDDTNKVQLPEQPRLLPIPKPNYEKKRVRRSKSEKFRRTQLIQMKQSKSFVDSPSDTSLLDSKSIQPDNETKSIKSNPSQTIPTTHIIDENNNEIDQSMHSLLKEETSERQHKATNDKKDEQDEELIVSAFLACFFTPINHLIFKIKLNLNLILFKLNSYFQKSI